MAKEKQQRGMGGSSQYTEEQQYLIELPHTKETCIKALNDIKDLGEDRLEMWSFGCAEGNHTGYALVDADSVSEALEFVPEEERNKAKIHKLVKMTPEEIEEMHK